MNQDVPNPAPPPTALRRFWSSILPNSPPPRGRASAICFATFGLIFGVVLAADWPREQARWILADADRIRVDGLLPDEDNRVDRRRVQQARTEALARLEKAFDVAPAMADLHAVRARWRMEQPAVGPPEAYYEAILADATQAVEAGAGAAPFRVVLIDALIHAGRYSEALRQFDLLVAGWGVGPGDGVTASEATPILDIPPRGPLARLFGDRRNVRAYIAALGGIELDRALEDINAALTDTGWPRKPPEDVLAWLVRQPSSRRLMWKAQLDTRAMVHLARGELEAAEADFRIVESMTVRWNWGGAVDVHRKQDAGHVNVRAAAVTYQLLQAEWAIYQNHRAALAEARGETELAQEIFRALTHLGFPIGRHLF